MISLDCETTGLDLRHSARPFFVTTCNELGEVTYWEAEVNPLTREVSFPQEDVDAIRDVISNADRLVLQNGKFDVTALGTLGITGWPWEKTEDTLIAGHLLASNQPHDLTSMALHYLGIDIEPYETRLKVACRRARHDVRVKKDLRGWVIAKEGVTGMPSVTKECWKYDMWLPKAVAQRLDYPEDHSWYGVLRDYSNVDSTTTMFLWKVMEAELRRRGLEKIYWERMRVMPCLIGMESRGVSESDVRLNELEKDYTLKREDCGSVCVNLARSMGHKLVLPKAGNNKTLLDFATSPRGLNMRTYREEGGNGALVMPRQLLTDTGKVSLNAESIGYCRAVLEVEEPRGKRLSFLRSFARKRKLDTALTYIASYRRFRLPLGEPGWYVLHPSFNVTGSHTLRWSSSYPNAQNISRKEDFNLRYTFGPAPGREWWSLDYENIELRIPAYESGERVMIELFEKPDDPPYFGSYHLLNASLIYPELFWPLADRKGKFKECYESTWYQWDKNFGFAFTYGGGEDTCDRAAHKKGAWRLIKDNLKEHTKLNQKYIALANKYGYVETLPDKTVDPSRGYPVMCTRTEYGRVLETVPLNYHVQSTAMWCTQKAMVRCADYLTRLGPEYVMVMQIHDELVFDFPKGGKKNLPKVMELKRLMELSGDDIGVPLKVAIKYNPVTWAEGAEPE